MDYPINELSPIIMSKNEDFFINNNNNHIINNSNNNNNSNNSNNSNNNISLKDRGKNNSPLIIANTNNNNNNNLHNHHNHISLTTEQADDETLISIPIGGLGIGNNENSNNNSINNPLQIDFDESENKYNQYSRTYNNVLSSIYSNKYISKIFGSSGSTRGGGWKQLSSSSSPKLHSGDYISLSSSTIIPPPPSSSSLSLEEQQQQPDQKIKFFGNSIMLYSAYMIFLYLIYGLLQEIIFKKQQVNFYNLYSFVQFLASFLFSVRGVLAETKTYHTKNGGVGGTSALSKYQYVIQKLSIKKIRLYLSLSFVLLMCKLLGNESLRYLNYKTKILFQSSKLIPVMVFGGFLFQRTYSMVDYLSVLSMIVGLVLFTVGDSLSSYLFSPLGVLMVLSYVFVESIKSILYEKILRDYSSELELSLFTNFFGTIMTLPIVFVSGEFKSSYAFFKDNIQVLILLSLFIFLGYYANITYLHLMRITDSLYANMMSSFRKDSILFYHILGILVFFFGIGVEMKHKSPRKNKDDIK
ncbi:hypothetical protein DFA_03026 [Cavenderia fasciculata]|uniref:Sugar phosphate transporter domain-containing protein n=1 Tax=Cavenderia fasciculata TaxID=261658 RepID=F4PGE8_CACFS|nr:uncharacterized protein DFA_03026 [Cavenderia fasciculata]EGG24782.1 hypothetical protein DFA_03026 [Cavenderia fasciculata]|eukprot:XP_004362633.1 hypothetical protein DFA_03026 [Cavenderia fasciculata]